MFFFINEFVNVSFITFIIGTVGLIKIKLVIGDLPCRMLGSVHAAGKGDEP